MRGVMERGVAAALALAALAGARVIVNRDASLVFLFRSRMRQKSRRALEMTGETCRARGEGNALGLTFY